MFNWLKRSKLKEIEPFSIHGPKSQPAAEMSPADAKRHLEIILAQRESIVRSLLVAAESDGVVLGEDLFANANRLGFWILKHARVKRVNVRFVLRGMPIEEIETDFDSVGYNACFALALYLSMGIEEIYGAEYRLQIVKLSRRHVNFQMPLISVDGIFEINLFTQVRNHLSRVRQEKIPIDLSICDPEIAKREWLEAAAQHEEEFGPQQKRTKKRDSKANQSTLENQTSDDVRQKLAAAIEDLTGKKGYPVLMEIQTRIERVIDFKLNPELDFVRVYLECLDHQYTHSLPMPIADSEEEQDAILLEIAAAVRNRSEIPPRVLAYIQTQNIADRFP
ncbi:MAG TPA: hypothetical protein VK171_15355 [Fimbriimonas sp.]|nr:hypothetical protein [Fimbriimonas sp.]